MKKIIFVLISIASGLGAFSQTVTTVRTQSISTNKNTDKNIPSTVQKNIQKTLYTSSRKMVKAHISTMKSSTTVSKNNFASRPAGKPSMIKHPLHLPDRKLVIQYPSNKQPVKQKKGHT